MPRSEGTRTKQNFEYERVDQGRETRSHTCDLGMTKNVTASITFVSGGTNQLQAANGTFVNFAVGDVILVEGTSLNNGYKSVVGIDGTNHSFLTVDPGCPNEGPVTATVRTR